MKGLGMMNFVDNGVYLANMHAECRTQNSEDALRSHLQMAVQRTYELAKQRDALAEELRNIRDAKLSEFDDDPRRRASQFVPWAQNRARYTLEKVGVGETARKVQRFRPTSERCNYIEESIYGDEVPLADWYLCETCGDLADSISELGFCYNLGESLKDQIAEYRREEAAHRECMKTHNANVTGLAPAQALLSALEFAKNDNMQDVLVVGYDGDGYLLVRSSRMDRKEALWLSEQLRKYALGDGA